jgi:hypothetical protein
MQCEEVRNEFTSYLTDALNEPLRSQVQHHLVLCGACAEEFEQLNRVWSRLGAIPGDEPTPQRRARFDSMLEVYRQGMEDAPAAQGGALHSWFGQWRSRQRLFQFAVGLALVAVGVIGGRSWRAPIQTDSELPQLRAELHSLHQMVALSLLQQQSASERLKGVSWSSRIEQPGDEVRAALLDTLMHDANVNVRLAAVDALRQFGQSPQVRHGLVQALERPNPALVEIAMIDLVVELRETQSVNALRRIATDETLDSAVRQRAEWGLSQLS